MMKKVLLVIKRLERFMKKWILIIYVLLGAGIFFPWKALSQVHGGIFIINLMMFVCNLVAAFFAIDNIQDKYLKGILLKSDSLKVNEVLAIISGKKDNKGKMNVFEKKYNCARKCRFPVWLGSNFLVIVIGYTYCQRVLGSENQFLNLYAYLNFLLFLMDFDLGNKLDKRVNILLNNKTKR